MQWMFFIFVMINYAVSSLSAMFFFFIYVALWILTKPLNELSRASV